MLNQKIKAIIQQEEKIRLDKYIKLCLSEQDDSYYKSKDPIGKKGDFTTAPEVSQMFGEIIGAWLTYCWQVFNQPSNISFIELGAGKGTLLSDVLRTVQKVSPELYSVLSIHIVDINETLIKKQKETLLRYSDKISWHNDISNIKTNNICFIFSNEFFDAFPIRQFKYIRGSWHEVYVSLNEHSQLQYCYESTSYEDLNTLSDLKENHVYEVSEDAQNYMHKVSALIFKNSGIALTCDYGYISPSNRSSLRGFKNHSLIEENDILKYYTEIDITHNINFTKLQNIGREYSLNTSYPIVSQKDFLIHLGILQRLENLSRNSSPENKKMLQDQVSILLNSMGEKFKFMLITSRNINTIAPFS